MGERKKESRQRRIEPGERSARISERGISYANERTMCADRSFTQMNYHHIKTHLEAAHAILIETGEHLDLHELNAFPSAITRKDWRMATAILEECGAATAVSPAFWRELLDAAKGLELPRYVARIEGHVRLAGEE